MPRGWGRSLLLAGLLHGLVLALLLSAAWPRLREATLARGAVALVVEAGRGDRPPTPRRTVPPQPAPAQATTLPPLPPPPAPAPANLPLPPPSAPKMTAPRTAAPARREAAKPAPVALAGPEAALGGAPSPGPAGTDRAARAEPHGPIPYPLWSRETGESGTVLIRVAVAPDGRAKNVEVGTSSGYKALDQAARKAVAGWRFQPALKHGVPVEAMLTFKIRFELQAPE